MSASTSADLAPLIDIEAERGLIGAALHNATLSITLGIEPHDFFEKLHQNLWRLAARAATTGGVFAAGPLAQQYPDMSDYLFGMLDFGESVVIDPRPLANRLKMMATRRNMMTAATQFIIDIRNMERHPEEDAVKFTSAISRNMVSRRAKTNQEIRREIHEELQLDLPTISTGIPEIDGVMGGGLSLARCVVIAAWTKVGKSALAGSISYNINQDDVPHLYCGFESSSHELEQRNIARELGINTLQFLTSKKKIAFDVGRSAVSCKNNTIYEHCPGGTFEELRAMVMSARINHGIKGFFLDSLQLVKGQEKGQNEEQHLRNVAQWCADICHEQKIFSVILVQCNDEGEPRGGKGVRLACDVYFRLHRKLDEMGAWMAMENSRYLPYSSVGDKLTPGLIMEPFGPYYRGASQPRVIYDWM